MDDFPGPIIKEIANYLDINEILNLSLTCKWFYKCILFDDQFIELYCKRLIKNTYKMRYYNDFPCYTDLIKYKNLESIISNFWSIKRKNNEFLPINNIPDSISPESDYWDKNILDILIDENKCAIGLTQFYGSNNIDDKMMKDVITNHNKFMYYEKLMEKSIELNLIMITRIWTDPEKRCLNRGVISSKYYTNYTPNDNYNKYNNIHTAHGLYVYKYEFKGKLKYEYHIFKMIIGQYVANGVNKTAILHLYNTFGLVESVNIYSDYKDNQIDFRELFKPELQIKKDGEDKSDDLTQSMIKNEYKRYLRKKNKMDYKRFDLIKQSYNMYQSEISYYDGDLNKLTITPAYIMEVFPITYTLFDNKPYIMIDLSDNVSLINVLKGGILENRYNNIKKTICLSERYKKFSIIYIIYDNIILDVL